MEDEAEPPPRISIKTGVTPSVLTSSTSSETSSNIGTDSQPITPITPITPFSRGSSPTFPSFEVAELQHSRLTLSLDLAANINNANESHESQKFDWLNLIQPDEECGLYRDNPDEPTSDEYWDAYKSLFLVRPRNLQRSGLAIALDLVPLNPEVTSGEGNQCQIPTNSEWLDLQPIHVTNPRDTVPEDKEPAQDDGVVDFEEGVESGQTVEVGGTKNGETVVAQGTISTSNPIPALERIDLDAVFGGTADDLCEDYEAKNRAARTTINTCAHQSIAGAVHASEKESSCNTSMVLFNAHPSSSNYSNPDSASTSLERSLPVKAEDAAAWYVSKWENMCAATQRAKQEGQYEHKPLQAADRSLDWMWEPTNEDNRHQYDPRIFSAAAEPAGNHGGKSNVTSMEKRTHHFNYLQQPVFHKSDTPPEVSLWAVCSGHTKGHHDKFSRQGVLSSQAGKLIDPFWYSGPPELLNYKGTRLRDEVTGYVDKVYHPIGTWSLDQYSFDEVVPHVIKDDAYTDIKNGPGYPYCPQPVHYSDDTDPEDSAINDDGRVHINKPKSDGNWVRPSSSPLKIVQAHSDELLNLELISPKADCTGLSNRDKDLSLVHRIEELSVLPAQSEQEIAAENEDFYNEPAVTDSPNLAEAEEGEQISDEPAATDSPNLAEAEQDEQSSAEESDVSEAGRAATTQLLRDMFTSPDFILTQRRVQAIMDGNEDEASAILAQRNELRASAPAPAINGSYEVGDDEEQIDYTDTWSRRNVRSVSNQDYLSRWSESAAIQVHDDGDFLEEEDPATDDVDCCGLSPDKINDATSRRSWSIEDDATPEDLELETMDDESPMIIARLRELGDLPPSSPEGQQNSHMDVDVGEATCEAGNEKPQEIFVMGSSSNHEFYAKVLEVVRNNDALLARDGVHISIANPEDATAPLSNIAPDDFFTSRGYTRPTTVDEEEELLDRGHVAAMMLQEQADARAEVLLGHYLEHVKRYHRKSWEITSDMVPSLEVAGTADETPSEQKDFNAGQSSVVSVPSPLLNPNAALASLHDCDTILLKSYQYSSSSLLVIPEDKGEDSEDKIDPASHLDRSPCGQSALEKRPDCTKVKLADFEECSEDIEDGLVWDEESQVIVEQEEGDSENEHDRSDTEEFDVGVISVSSKGIADMNTENLDGLLSEVSGMLATFPGSGDAVQDSPAGSDTIHGVLDEEDVELDQGTLEQEQLVKEKAQLAEEARKLAEQEKQVAEREEKLAEAERRLAQREKDLAEEMKTLAEEKAQLAREKQLADQNAEDEKAKEERAEEDVVDHTFDTLSSPADIPPATPTFNKHFFGSFAIAVGGKASKLAMGLSGVLRSSAAVLHRR